MSNKLISPKLLRWLTFYLLLALIILLLYANLFPSGSSASGAVAKTPITIPTRTHTLTHPQQTATAVAVATAKAAATATVVAANQPTPLDPTPQQLALTKVNCASLTKGGDTQASKDVNTQLQQKVDGNPKIQNHQAAFVILFVNETIPVPKCDAQKLAKAVEDILKMQPVFSRAQYQSVIFTGTVTDETGNSPNPPDLSEVDLEIFLYAQNS